MDPRNGGKNHEQYANQCGIDYWSTPIHPTVRDAVQSPIILDGVMAYS